MFNKYPVNPVTRSFDTPPLQTGFDPVLRRVLESVQRHSGPTYLLAIDGTHGAPFQLILQKLIDTLEKNGEGVAIHSTADYLLSGEELRDRFAANITDNRAFGYVTEGRLPDYFEPEAQGRLKDKLTRSQSAEGSSAPSVIIVFGPGADWLVDSAADELVFLDVSREYQQVEYKRQLLNFGMSWNRDSVEKYKIAYFVEWPILEGYRKQLLQRDFTYLDMNQPSRPVMTHSSALRQLIAVIASNPLRVKPFFAPGVWGGQYLKQMADLPEEMVNCAWSFEPIAPENSILIGHEDQVIEVPFLIVMALEHLAIMGDRPVKLFGDYFPVRFDYLDTIDGDHLSCQVHPKQSYIREQFNEKMAQQESYYIMEKKGDAKVYLGLTDQSTKESFLGAVSTAQESGVPMPFTDYVQEWDANKGDLYLIPTGTVHCSGKGNLVLEISSTTWWFTFKLYDYLRKDLDGKPRPINIDHGFENIDFDKKTEWVQENLIPSPRLMNSQGKNEEYLLGQHEDLLFYVRRIHLEDEWKDDTNGEFVMYNLVEGEKVRIVSSVDESVSVELNFGESYILPSVLGEYRIVNLGSSSCRLVKAGVSPQWDVALL